MTPKKNYFNQMLHPITDTFAFYRDDVFPYLGGGNKARKMMALDDYIKN